MSLTTNLTFRYLLRIWHFEVGRREKEGRGKLSVPSAGADYFVIVVICMRAVQLAVAQLFKVKCFYKVSTSLVN